MEDKVKKYIDSILNEGLEKNYWFMTKQTMSDFYFIFTIAKIVDSYNSCRLPNDNFGSYYSRYFSENPELSKKYPKQAESENTYRNAIIAEFFGLFYREKSSYDSGKVTPAFNVLSKFIKCSSDIEKFRFIIDRQIEKLCLNINENIQNSQDLLNVKIFPVLFLYKLMYELKRRTGDSTLYYDEFVLFVFRTKTYSDWEKVLELILAYRESDISEDYKNKCNRIINDVTATNIRFDALFGTLTNVEYVKKSIRNYFKLKEGYSSIRYVENAIEIFESSKYSKSLNKNELIEFVRSDKYFIGNLDVPFSIDDNEQDKPSEDFDNTNRLKCGVNIILYGVPGAGKSYTINAEYRDENTIMERVVFHPDYTYSDFVGQILPKSENGDVSYEFTAGPFTKILKNAYRDPEKKYLLVIEEINRGNAPAIFGDIFQLLDRNPQTKDSDYGITNDDIAKIVYHNENHMVKIPSNMSIICTMNTSDQNVFTLDTAFQRRWNMRLIENSFKKDTPEEKAFAEKPILDTEVSWEQFCTTINVQILEKNQNMTSSEDKRLGTHFVSLEDLTYDQREHSDNMDSVIRKEARLHNRRFPEKVIKYLWDDAFKFYRDEIFRGEFNSLEKVIKEFTERTKNDRFNIFKDNIKAAITDKK